MLGDSGQGPISDGGGPGRLLAFAVAIALVLGGAWLYWKLSRNVLLGYIAAYRAAAFTTAG